MDDYNVSVLSEAKNEYSLRIVTILYPLFLEGIKSILKEAWELCLSNDEEEKYLMTFQNFLSRIIKWNTEIIANETKREAYSVFACDSIPESKSSILHFIYIF